MIPCLAVFRVALFSCMFGYVAKTFGYASFGRISGLVSTAIIFQPTIHKFINVTLLVAVRDLLACVRACSGTVDAYSSSVQLGFDPWSDLPV